MDDDDWGSRADESVGRLCWFREPPLIRAVVRVISANKSSKRIDVTLMVVASAARRPVCHLDVGSLVEVSLALPNVYAGLWMLHPLEADDLEGAIAEVAADQGGRPIDWRRSGAPS